MLLRQPIQTCMTRMGTLTSSEPWSRTQPVSSWRSGHSPPMRSAITRCLSGLRINLLSFISRQPSIGSLDQLRNILNRNSELVSISLTWLRCISVCRKCCVRLFWQMNLNSNSNTWKEYTHGLTRTWLPSACCQKRLSKIPKNSWTLLKSRLERRREQLRSRRRDLSLWMMKIMIGTWKTCFTMRRGLSIKAYSLLERGSDSTRLRTSGETLFQRCLRANLWLKKAWME